MLTDFADTNRKSDEVTVTFLQMQRYKNIIPICMIIIFLSIFPLSFGIDNKTWYLIIPSGLVLILALVGMVWRLVLDTRASDKMLSLSNEVIPEMNEGLDYLKSTSQLVAQDRQKKLIQMPSPSSYLH